jgi:hypothetical protein
MVPSSQYRTEPEEHMSNPYGELIGLLNALKEKLGEPVALMTAVSQREQLVAEVHQAKAALQESLGQIPLPMDHPQWQAISGGIFAALGAVDGFIDYEQELKQKAHDAVAACQQASQSVDNAIGGFAAGNG